MGEKKTPKAALMGRRVERRRQRRIDVQIGVLAKVDNKEMPLLTENVTRGGLFIQTDEPLEPRRMIRLVIDLGEAGEPFEVVGAIRHTVSVSQGQERGVAAGMGVQLYALSRSARIRWDAFCDRLEANEDSGSQTPLAQTPGPQKMIPTGKKQVELDGISSEDIMSAPPTRPDIDEFSTAPRTEPSGPQPVHFTLRIRDLLKMNDFLAQGFEHGGIFLASDKDVETGTPAQLTLVHPETSEEFILYGEVVQITHTADGSRGLGIQLVNLTDELKAELDEFTQPSSQKL